jgi:predicted Zn finger-like uncharacterized protein
MILDCPSCNARYELPEDLIGPAGARVRCPSCGASFAVDPAGRRVSEPPAPEPMATAPAMATADEAPAPVAPAELARALIASFIEGNGDALREARERGRLFAEWGPALLDLFQEYQRAAGPAAGSTPFRDELREHLGIDLPAPSSD